MKKLLILILVVAIFTSSCMSTEEKVNIPDPVLRSALKKPMGKHFFNSIYVTDMERLTKFSYTFFMGGPDRKPIRDITGLEYCTNLNSLFLGGNWITDISSLTDLIGLESLTLQENNISDITPLVSLKNLSWLDLSSNQIKDISSLSNLPGLTTLSLKGDNISDRSALARLTKLQYLELSGKQISDISPLTSMKDLKSLHLRGTNRPGLIVPFSASQQPLKASELSDSQLSDITGLSSLTGLTEISIISTRVSDISPLLALKNLERCELINNPMDDKSLQEYVPALRERGVQIN